MVDITKDKRKHGQSGQNVEMERNKAVFIPETDIYEQNDAFVLEVDMPGVENNSVDINIDRRELSITGHVDQKPIEGHTLSYAEYRVGDYQRLFQISDQIDIDKIDASMKNGVLFLRLPKSAEAKPKKITVKAD